MAQETTPLDRDIQRLIAIYDSDNEEVKIMASSYLSALADKTMMEKQKQADKAG